MPMLRYRNTRIIVGENIVRKKDLLNESNELIIDLMKDKITDQEAFMTYKFILFFYRDSTIVLHCYN